MKITREFAAEITNKIEEIKENGCFYGVFGIRVQEESFELGTMDHCSYVWIEGEQTDEELPGVCAISEKAINNQTHEYFGNHVAVIAGDRYTYGVDPGEIIIEDPEVVYIFA